MRRPAAQSGKIKVGDTLLRVNGMSTAGMKVDAVRNMLKRMDTGTPVTLTFLADKDAAVATAASSSGTNYSSMTSSDDDHAAPAHRLQESKLTVSERERQAEAEAARESKRQAEAREQRELREREQQIEEASRTTLRWRCC